MIETETLRQTRAGFHAVQCTALAKLLVRIGDSVATLCRNPRMPKNPQTNDVGSFEPANNAARIPARDLSNMGACAFDRKHQQVRRSKMKLLPLAVLLAIAGLVESPAWAINKCTQPDGSIVFQDAVCTGVGKSETLTVRPASGHSNADTSESAAKTKANVARINRRFETQAAIKRGEPLIGMTSAELDQAMGLPDRANLANYNGTPHNQLIYERNGRTLYVYTDGGLVKAIQDTESVGSSRKAAVRCPNSMEIRSMETSASSITLSERERIQRRKEIAEARKCGQ